MSALAISTSQSHSLVSIAAVVCVCVWCVCTSKPLCLMWLAFALTHSLWLEIQSSKKQSTLSLLPHTHSLYCITTVCDIHTHTNCTLFTVCSATHSPRWSVHCHYVTSLHNMLVYRKKQSPSSCHLHNAVWFTDLKCYKMTVIPSLLVHVYVGFLVLTGSFAM